MRAPQRSLILGLIIIESLLFTRTMPAQGPSSDTAAAAVQRALTAYGQPLSTGEIGDSIGDGKLTFFALGGAKATFNLTLMLKGNTKVQRVIKEPAGELKQGTDGVSSWESFQSLYTPTAHGRALQFIESHTTRSLPRLFNYQKEGLTLRDMGSRDKARLVEAEDRQGKKTTYFIDADTSVINKFEFVTGQAKDPFSGAQLSAMDTYVFSDHRMIQGVLTAFKIERYSGSNKIEEIQFSTVKYNAGLKDSDFHR